MNQFNNFDNVDYIMQNGVLSEDTEQYDAYSETSYFKTGGNNSDDDNSDDNGDEDNKPNGGFPNIVLCDEDIKESSQVDQSRREFTADKAILSISSILKSRRNMAFNKP